MPTTLLAQNSSSDDASERGQGSAANRVQQRIDQLTREKFEALRANADMRAKYDSLASEVASLKEALTTKQSSGDAKHKDWSDLSESELMQIAEEHGATNPAYLSRVTKELARREAAKVREELREEYSGTRKADTMRQQVTAKIANEFGAEVLKADSPIYKKALEVAQELVGLYGAKEVQSSPMNEYLIFAEAARRLGATTPPAQSDDAERLRAQAKSRQAVEAGVNSAARSSASLKDLVQRGDVKGALRQLDTVRVLRGEEPKGPEPDASDSPPSL